MITRTFIQTVATLMVVNRATNKVETTTVTVNGTMNTADVEKAIRGGKVTLADNLLLVQCMSTAKSEKLYGMEENDFLKYAVELDEKRKPVKK